MEQPSNNTQPQGKPEERTMFGLVEEQQKSGLTVKVFCQKHDIAPHTYYYWVKKYRNKHRMEANEKAAFTRLQLPGEVSGSLFCEIVTSSGGRLRFYQPVSATYLQSLL